jgi:hypothetical protein
MRVQGVDGRLCGRSNNESLYLGESTGAVVRNRCLERALVARRLRRHRESKYQHAQRRSTRYVEHSAQHARRTAWRRTAHHRVHPYPLCRRRARECGADDSWHDLEPGGIAIDANGNVWVANYIGNSVTELSGGTGSALSPANVHKKVGMLLRLATRSSAVVPAGCVGSGSS